MSKRNQGTALLLNKNQVCDMYDYVCTALSNHFDACKKEYIKHMDRELQLRLGNSIARDIRPSWCTFARDLNQLQQRSIETWVLTADQHDAIVMVLMKLAEKMNTFEVRLPTISRGELNASRIVPEGR